MYPIPFQETFSSLMSRFVFYSSLHALNFLFQSLAYISKQETSVDLKGHSLFKTCWLLFTLRVYLFLHTTGQEDYISPISLLPQFPYFPKALPTLGMDSSHSGYYCKPRLFLTWFSWLAKGNLMRKHMRLLWGFWIVGPGQYRKRIKGLSS